MRKLGIFIGVVSVVSGCTSIETTTQELEYPIIDLSSQWLEFGEVPYGETVTRSFVIQNQGDLPLGVSDIFEGRGQDTNFDIVYDVSTIVCPEGTDEEGTEGAEGEDSGDAGASKSWSPAPAATALFSPAEELDFGFVPFGTTASQLLTITNVGADPLTFASDAFITPRDTEGFTIGSGEALSSVTLNTGEEHRIYIDYAPPVDGDSNEAQIFVISNDETTPSASIRLVGTTVEEIDTGEPVTDDSGEDTGAVIGDDQVLFTLDASCRISVDVTFTPVDVGEIYGSVIVETATQQRDDEEEPEYWSDLDHDRNIIYLQGESELTEGRLVVTPRSLDFGHIWAGEEEVLYVQVANAGDGELTLQHPYLDEACSDAYNISWSYAPGETDEKVLEGGAKTLLEVSFIPEDQNDAYCTLIVTSTDPDTPEEQVYLQGNAGVDPTNNLPTVSIRSPQPGYVHNSLQPMPMEINVFDRDQPATSLTCRVKSSILVGATITYCTPPDESGHVYVDVPMDDFDPGTDTIQVLVTDVAGTTSMASVPVIINSGYPDSDDDGDGFGSGNEDPSLDDCNDDNTNSYPNAAEIEDGEDNDCDLLIDEGTEGADDDGDTFTEREGDCDDNDEFSMPGVAEAADNKDNDCDGTVDEGTTLSDDDGDGYAEVNNDCDDELPTCTPAPRSSATTSTTTATVGSTTPAWPSTPTRSSWVAST